MTDSDKLTTILENSGKGEILDSTELEILLSAVQSGQITLAKGEKSVAIGGSADGAMIVTGGIVVQGLGEKTVRELIRSALKNTKSTNLQTADRQNNLNQAGKKTTRKGKTTPTTKSVRKPKTLDFATLTKISQNTAILNSNFKTEPERISALQSLGRIAIGNDRVARSIVVRLKTEKNHNIIAKAIEILAKISYDKSSASLVILEVLTRNKNSSVIISAMTVFAKIAIENTKVIQPMLSLLSNDDLKVKKSIINSLGVVAIGHTAAIDRLLCILESSKSSSTIKQAAADSLGKIVGGHQNAVPRMERVLRMEKSNPVKKRITVALNKIERDN